MCIRDRPEPDPSGQIATGRPRAAHIETPHPTGGGRSVNPLALLKPNRHAARVVPPSGHTAWLTSFTAGAMAFLAVFALALSLAAGRLADRWSDALERTATCLLYTSRCV